MLWNYKFCDNRNAMKQCNFQTIMVPLYSGRFVVVHLHSSFSIKPHDLPLGENLYQNLPFLAILGTVSPHF